LYNPLPPLALFSCEFFHLPVLPRTLYTGRSYQGAILPDERRLRMATVKGQPGSTSSKSLLLHGQCRRAIRAIARNRRPYVRDVKRQYPEDGPAKICSPHLLKRAPSREKVSADETIVQDGYRHDRAFVDDGSGNAG
jgi:hypothetical protein